MSFRPVFTDKAPRPVGPYSQAFRVGPWLFCSGQIPLDAKGEKVLGEDVESQTQQIFKNIQAVLSAENMSLKNVVKTTVFLTDMAEFSKFNPVYESYFSDHKPARSCVEVSALPKGVQVEIEVLAFQSE